MPDEAVPLAPTETVPAAPDTVVTPDVAPVAEVTPEPAQAKAEPEGKTLEDYLAILRGGPDLASKKERDPLANEDVDPLSRDIEGMSDPLLTCEEPEAEEPAVEAPPVQETQPEPNATPAEAPAVTPAAEDEDGKLEGRKRLNINRKKEDGTPFYSARDRAFLQLVAEGLSTEEAMRTMGAPAQSAATHTDPAKPAESATPAETVESLTEKIAALRAKREVAMVDYKQTEAAKLTDQIEDALTARESLARKQELSDRDQQVVTKSFESSVADSMAKAMRDYPESAKEGSPMRLAIDEKLSELEGAAMFAKPDWPQKIAAMVAAERGIAKAADAAKAAAAQSTVTPAPTAKPGAKPAAPAVPVKRAFPVPGAGGVGGGSPSPAQNLSTQIAEAQARHDLPKLRELTKQVLALQKAA